MTSEPTEKCEACDAMKPLDLSGLPTYTYSFPCMPGSPMRKVPNFLAWFLPAMARAEAKRNQN